MREQKMVLIRINIWVVRSRTPRNCCPGTLEKLGLRISRGTDGWPLGWSMDMELDVFRC